MQPRLTEFASAMEMFLVVLAVFRRVVLLQRVGSARVVGEGGRQATGMKSCGWRHQLSKGPSASVAAAAAAASSAASCVLLLIHFCQLLN